MTDREVAEFFDTNVDEYSVGLKEGSEEKLDFVREVTGDEIEPRVLDVGCGSAEFAAELAETIDTQHVYGTEVARGMFTEESVDVRLLLSDGKNLPFQSETFHLIHMDTVLHHIVGGSRKESKKYARDTVSELFRVLKPGGYVLLTERIQKGRLLSDRTLSYAIFYGLRYGSKLLHPFHPLIHEKQPPICFYTFDEIESMIDDSPGEIIRKDVFSHPNSYLIEKPFYSSSLRVTFYIEKKADQIPRGRS